MARELSGRRAHSRYQGHGGLVPAPGRAHADFDPETGSRYPHPFPHARHQRYRRGQRTCRGRGGCRCRGCRHGRHERTHLPTQPRLDRRGPASRPARTRPRSDAIRAISHYRDEVRQAYAAFESEERAGASEVYVHGMPRAVHEPARTGPRTGARRTLAGCRTRLCGRQRAVRRHRQGHAEFESWATWR